MRRAAWNGGIPFASENGRLHYDKQGYNKILENAKPSNDTLGGYLPSFTYLRLSPKILEGRNFVEFERFVRRMHGITNSFVYELIIMGKRVVKLSIMQ